MKQPRSDDESSTAAVIEKARQAIDPLEAAGRFGRAELLDDLARRFLAAQNQLAETARKESHLPESRLTSEVERVAGQFRLFAQVLRDGAYLALTSDSLPDAGRLVRMNLPLGVVGVFGASNFPLAFSVPGGDTASALAAGCPVVVKVHSLHPDTSRLCADLIRDGLEAAGLPCDAIGLVYGREAAIELVQHPDVAAVAFTGSREGGAALRAAIDARRDPIPFYGELGSVNPVLVLPGAASRSGTKIGQQLAESVMFCQGQLCTRPGLIWVPAGAPGQSVIAGLRAAISASDGGPMLSESILRHYQRRIDEQAATRGTTVLARGAADGNDAAAPALLAATLHAARSPAVRSEVFGPSAVVIPYPSVGAALAEIAGSDPALAASVFHDPEEDRDDLIRATRVLERSVGRLVFNGVTTGVAVNWSQNHTGPWPASTTRHTSVGAAAIERFVRPVAWQNPPDWVLRQEAREPATVPARAEGRMQIPD